MSREWCCAIAGGIRLSVHILPNDKKSEVVGVLDDALKIRLQAQPIEGKANEALIRYLAGLLDIPRNTITITHGQTARRKTLKLDAPGLTLDALTRALLSRPDGK